MEETIRLGGNIELTGFNILSGSEMVVIKKIVGSYAKKIEGMCKDFNSLKLRLKPLHMTEDKVKKFEMYGQVVDSGQVMPASTVEHNLYVGVDAVCKKLVNTLNPN